MADEVTPQAGELTTANYNWVKPTVGASVDAWGGYINTDLDGIDSTVKSVSNAIPVVTTTTPAMNGTAAIGASGKWSDGAHVHPTDTTLLPKAGGTMTGALTVSQTAGIVGTTTNNNAAAGAIGEVISSNVAPGAVTGLTSGATVNITSISLTAGDWDVSANGAINPAPTTVLTAAGGGIYFGISTTTAALPATAQGLGLLPTPSGLPAGQPFVVSLGTMRLSLASTTTVYLVVNVTYSTSTCGSYGYLWARRAR